MKLKTKLILGLVGLLLVALCWYVFEMWGFANGVNADAKRLNSFLNSKKEGYLYKGSSKTMSSSNIFKSNNDSIKSQMSLITLNDTIFSFTLTYKNQKENCSVDFQGQLKNIDPNADFDESDPSGVGEATQLYEYIDNNTRIEMAIPFYNPKIIGVKIYSQKELLCNSKYVEFILEKE